MSRNFSTLPDTTISYILTYLLPTERALCAEISKLFMNNVYSSIAFSDCWIIHQPYIHKTRSAFTQSIHYRGYNNALAINLLPYKLRKYHSDQYLQKHKELQQILTNGIMKYEVFDMDSNKEDVQIRNASIDKEYDSLKLLYHIPCLCIAKDVALVLYNLSQIEYKYTMTMTQNVRFLILHLPHPSLSYRYRDRKNDIKTIHNNNSNDTDDDNKYDKLHDMTQTIQNGLDLFTKLKYLCLIQLNPYYLQHLKLNKLKDLIVLHLYDIHESLNWKLLIQSLSNNDIVHQLLAFSLEHCNNIPIQQCQKLFNCFQNIKHLTLIRNHFKYLIEDDVDNEPEENVIISLKLKLPSTIASLVWFNNNNVIPIINHCHRLWQLFCSYTEIIEIIPLFFSNTKHIKDHTIKQLWIIDQTIKIPLSDFLSDDSDQDQEQNEFKDNSFGDIARANIQNLDVYVRDIYMRIVKEKFNCINCNFYSIQRDYHETNPFYTLNECSFLTKLRLCTDIFCLDDVLFDGV